MRAGSEVSVQPLDLIVITIGRNHVNFKRVFAGCNIEVGNVVHFDCAKDWVPLILAMQIEIEDEMFHVWHSMATLMPEGDAGVERIARYITEHWN